MATDETARVALLRGIYPIVNDGETALSVAKACIDAGVTVLQYRAKRGIDPHRLRALRDLTRAHHCLLIVNDDWRAALDFDCDGVHLGPDDDGFTDVAPVRAALGSRIIGLSCGTVGEAREANRLGADYIGVGAVYATASKSDAGEPIGIDGLRTVCREATMPVAAIGGINGKRLADVRATGVAMAAVISAIAGAADPAHEARMLVEMWNTRGGL